MSLPDALLRIIGTIPENMVFDSHYIINSLIINESDIYLNLSKNISSGSDLTTEKLHSEIAKAIGKIPGIKKLDYESYSFNIHYNASKCSLWQKK
jgi:hypothetical protein